MHDMAHDGVKVLKSVVGIGDEVLHHPVGAGQTFTNDIVGFAVEDGTVDGHLPGKKVKLRWQQVVLSEGDINLVVGAQVDEIGALEVKERGVVVGEEVLHGVEFEEFALRAFEGLKSWEL
jgi:hypothetical protein